MKEQTANAMWCKRFEGRGGDGCSSPGRVGGLVLSVLSSLFVCSINIGWVQAAPSPPACC